MSTDGLSKLGVARAEFRPGASGEAGDIGLEPPALSFKGAPDTAGTGAPPQIPPTTATTPATDDVEVAMNEPEGELEVSTPGEKPRGWGVLRHKHYRNVWFGQFGSSMGNWLEHVGVSWIINVTSKDPALALSYLSVVALGPMLLLGIPGGLLADRVNRKKLLLVTQFVMMLIAGGLAVTSYVGHDSPSVPLMLVLIGLNGVTIPFNAPAWQVLTPRLVPKEELTSAIFLNGLQFNLARVLGPAAGGVMLGLWGPTVLFVINTVSFVGVMVAVASTPDTPAPAPTEKSLWHQTVEAFKFMLHEAGPRAVLIAIVIFGLLAAPLMRFLPMFVTRVFSHTVPLDKPHQELWYGALLAMMGIGAVSGVGLVKLVPKWYPKHHLIPVSILGSGVGITLFAATTNVYLACAALMISGVFWLWTFNTGFAAIQILVPDSMRGRAMAVLNVAVFGSMALGPFVTGNLGSNLNSSSQSISAGQGIQIGVAATGVALAVAAIFMLIWRTPEVDGLKPGDPGYDKTRSLIRGFTASVHRPSADGARCPTCNYLLKGLPSADGSVTCPECATVVDPEMLRKLANKPKAFP